ncbi:MAG: hypothetical protein E5W82_10510 [Mesorhizobium sp.]|nr:MAG: hypothetical protein E5W82_10510 [Mesorhizobium sp.]
MTTNRCRKQDEARDPSTPFQVIFEITGIDGKRLDYCRETRTAAQHPNGVEAWADTQCVMLEFEHRHNGKTFGYRVERW